MVVINSEMSVTRRVLILLEQLMLENRHVRRRRIVAEYRDLWVEGSGFEGSGFEGSGVRFLSLIHI